MIKEVVNQFGSLDVLVNNAGITKRQFINANERARMG